jgi:hypothetical protein
MADRPSNPSTPMAGSGTTPAWLDAALLKRTIRVPATSLSFVSS